MLPRKKKNENPILYPFYGIGVWGHGSYNSLFYSLAWRRE
jgi:hypothetical protein